MAWEQYRDTEHAWMYLGKPNPSGAEAGKELVEVISKHMKDKKETETS